MNHDHRIAILNNIPPEIRVSDLKSLAIPFNGAVEAEIHREKDLLSNGMYALITFHQEQDADDFAAVVNNVSLIPGDKPLFVQKLSDYKEAINLKLSVLKREAAYIRYLTSESSSRIFCFFEPVSELTLIDEQETDLTVANLSFPVKQSCQDFTATLEFISIDGETRLVALFKTDNESDAEKVQQSLQGRSFKGKPIDFRFLVLE